MNNRIYYQTFRESIYTDENYQRMMNEVFATNPFTMGMTRNAPFNGMGFLESLNQRLNEYINPRRDVMNTTENETVQHVRMQRITDDAPIGIAAATVLRLRESAQAIDVAVFLENHPNIITVECCERQYPRQEIIHGMGINEIVGEHGGTRVGRIPGYDGPRPRRPGQRWDAVIGRWVDENGPRPATPPANPPITAARNVFEEWLEEPNIATNIAAATPQTGTPEPAPQAPRPVPVDRPGDHVRRVIEHEAGVEIPPGAVFARFLNGVMAFRLATGDWVTNYIFDQAEEVNAWSVRGNTANEIVVDEAPELLMPNEIAALYATNGQLNARVQIGAALHARTGEEVDAEVDALQHQAQNVHITTGGVAELLRTAHDGFQPLTPEQRALVNDMYAARAEQVTQNQQEPPF